MKNVKPVLAACILVMLCACGGAPVQPTPTSLPAPTSAPVTPSALPLVKTAIAISSPTDAPKPADSSLPTETPKPTEAPKDVEVKSAAELINTVTSELKKAGLGAKVVKRGDSRTEDFNTFKILGTEVRSISMIGQGNVSDGSKYKGLDAKSMQILTEKAIKAFQDEGYDPKDIIICGKPLGSFQYMLVIQNEDIGQAEAQRDALKKNPLFSKAWTPNSGSFEYKGGNFVIRISSQSPEAYDYGNDLLAGLIRDDITNLQKDKFALSIGYINMSSLIGRRLNLTYEDYLARINKMPVNSYIFSFDSTSKTLTRNNK